MSAYIELSSVDVALAALLLVVNGSISVALRLGMERTLMLAGLRTIVQLSLVGLLLEWIFRIDRWYLVMGLLIVMTIVAGYSAVSRTDRKYKGILLDTTLSIWCSSWLIAAFALSVVVRDKSSWYEPQYTIPLMGMILGNTLNGVSVGLQTLTQTLYDNRGRIESALALGATRFEAALPSVQRAVRTGMTPIVNAMMVVGIVSLPGMMTGQLLAGTAPADAVKYQIVIMFLIASATALGTVGAVLLSYRRLFSPTHRLRFELLSPNDNYSMRHGQWSRRDRENR